MTSLEPQMLMRGPWLGKWKKKWTCLAALLESFLLFFSSRSKWAKLSYKLEGKIPERTAERTAGTVWGIRGCGTVTIIHVEMTPASVGSALGALESFCCPQLTPPLSLGGYRSTIWAPEWSWQGREGVWASFCLTAWHCYIFSGYLYIFRIL